VTAPDPLWESFAAREPFFAVIPNEAHRRANLTPERERAFFATGETRVEWIFKMIEPLVPEFAPLAILDYGCGIGRLTLPLASRANGGGGRSIARPARPRTRGSRKTRRHERVASGAGRIRAAGRRFDLVVCHGDVAASAAR
jgi:hypothetical protein